MYYDAKNHTNYLDGNQYLPYLNNEKDINSTYKERIIGLELMYLT